MSQHQVLIGIGSNIQRAKHIRQGVAAIKQQFASVRCSRVYESEAVGFDGAAFFNLVVEAHTDMDIAAVCRCLKAIERQNGRQPNQEKFSARTLDLDLLTYDRVISDQPVVLPREEILFNAFVLQPLAELVPDEIHPVVKRSYRVLWQDFDQSAQQLRAIEFSME